jgi:hypothetical protein
VVAEATESLLDAVDEVLQNGEDDTQVFGETEGEEIVCGRKYWWSKKIHRLRCGEC